MPRTKPVERFAARRAIRVIDVIGPELVTQLIERYRIPLHALPSVNSTLVTEPAEAHLERRLVLVVILQWIDGSSRFEHQRAQAKFGKLLGSPTAGHPGSHDNGVEISRGALLHRVSRSGR